MRISSFTTKLLLSYAAVVVVSFGVTAFFIDKTLESKLFEDTKESLSKQVRLMDSAAVLALSGDNSQADAQKTAMSLAAAAGCRVTIINISGEVLADSEKRPEEIQAMENHIHRPEIRSAMAGNTGVDTRRSPTLGIDMLYVARPVYVRGQLKGALRGALSLSSVAKRMAMVRSIVLYGFLFALTLAISAGSVMAARTTRPIVRMIRASRRFSKGDFSHRIMHVSNDEIGELAATLNSMAQEIEEGMSRIKSQNQELSALFGSMIEGVIVIDSSSRIISLNRAIEKTFGVTKDDAEGKMLLEAIRNNEIADVMEAVLRKVVPVSVELKLAYPVRRNLEINAVPITSGGAASGCLAVIHDITQIRRLETVRRDFLANAAHELRTPLTSIKGFVETLVDGAIDDKNESLAFLKIIGEHTDRLDRLVNDLLSLSSLESSEMALNKAELDLRDLAKEVILGFGARAKKRGIEIENKLRSGLTVRADREKMAQVLTNLIDNAIKFNKPNGSIVISALDLPGLVKIVVEDSGIGIPAKDIPRIFERFYRVDKARSRELGGTGLGLSIVKHIIALHDGSVGVDSTEGAGCAFWFSMPR